MVGLIALNLCVCFLELLLGFMPHSLLGCCLWVFMAYWNYSCSVQPFAHGATLRVTAPTHDVPAGFAKGEQLNSFNDSRLVKSIVTITGQLPLLCVGVPPHPRAVPHTPP